MVIARVRFGILGNQENECASPDSRIGIGGANAGTTTVGNAATGIYNPDNGAADIKSFGYLFVR